MTSNSATLSAPAAPSAMSAGMTFIMAAACGLIAANLYYAQPLISSIGPKRVAPALA